jgi:hypothetical protein
VLDAAIGLIVRRGPLPIVVASLRISVVSRRCPVGLDRVHES